MVNLTDAFYLVTLNDHNLSSNTRVVTSDGTQEPPSATLMANEGNKLHARRRMPQKTAEDEDFLEAPTRLAYE